MKPMKIILNYRCAKDLTKYHGEKPEISDERQQTWGSQARISCAVFGWNINTPRMDNITKGLRRTESPNDPGAPSCARP